MNNNVKHLPAAVKIGDQSQEPGTQTGFGKQEERGGVTVLVLWFPIRALMEESH